MKKLYETVSKNIDMHNQAQYSTYTESYRKTRSYSIIISILFFSECLFKSLSKLYLNQFGGLELCFFFWSRGIGGIFLWGEGVIYFFGVS